MRKATTEFLPGDQDNVWQQITEAARASKDRRYVAVAYIGSDGSALLPLRKGDVLIVDLSKPCVASGATNPKEIRRYIKNGVSVYSHADLHAKVFVFGPVAVVGSTNVSINSRDNLEEAAIKTTVPKAVEHARAFVCSLADDRDLVTPPYLAECLRLYRPPRGHPGVHSGPSNSSLENWSEQVMRKLGTREHRTQQGYFIGLSKFSNAIDSAWLRHPRRGGAGVQSITLDLYPGDTVRQARDLYPKLDFGKFIDLRKKGWTVVPNLHFSKAQRGLKPHVENPPMGLKKYIEYWKSHLDETRIKRTEFKKIGRNLYRDRLMPRDKLEEYEKYLQQDYKNFKTLDIRPGLKISYHWLFETNLPSQDKFVGKVRAKIDEALKTWGDRWGKLAHD